MNRADCVNEAVDYVGNCVDKKAFCLAFAEQVISQSHIVIPSKALLLRHYGLTTHFKGESLLSVVTVFSDLSATKLFKVALSANRIKSTTRVLRRRVNKTGTPKQRYECGLEVVLPIIRSLKSDDAFHFLMIVKKAQFGHKHGSFCPYELNLSNITYISDPNSFHMVLKSESATSIILTDLCLRLSNRGTHG